MKQITRAVVFSFVLTALVGCAAGSTKPPLPGKADFQPPAMSGGAAPEETLSMYVFSGPRLPGRDGRRSGFNIRFSLSGR